MLVNQRDLGFYLFRGFTGRFLPVIGGFGHEQTMIGRVRRGEEALGGG